MKRKVRCGHEVPCTCSEHLDQLTKGHLVNYRAEFGTVITNGDKAIKTGNAIPISCITQISGFLGFLIEIVEKAVGAKTIRRWDRNLEKRQAKKSVARINRVLHKKFGFVIV